MTSTPFLVRSSRRTHCAGCGQPLRDPFRETWYCRACQGGSRFWRFVTGLRRQPHA